MSERTPLWSALARHAAMERTSMHTPGHKGCAGILRGLDLSLDLTELPDTDALYEADGVIARAEELAAGVFGAHRTVFSAGGCSLAIQAMLRCACGEGDKIIMDRGSHRMAVNAAALLGLEPVWLLSEEAWKSDGLCPLPSPADVARLLSAHPDAKAVYITSPDYMGRLCDVSAIAELCRGHGIPLLVDNAHGSHLVAFDGLHPLAQGASMTACSAHKTLPVLTGGAFLSSSDPALSRRMKGAMSLFGSTSPSYLIMASLDLCRDWLENEGMSQLRATAVLCGTVRSAAVAAGFGLPSGDCDPMRITLLTRSADMSGTHAADYLRKRGYEPEYADDACVVLLPTPFVPAEKLRLLADVIADIPGEDNKERTAPPIGDIMAIARSSEAKMTVRAAALAPRETVFRAHAAGRIAAASVCPCPPGVPVVMPGEVITPEAAQLLAALGAEQVECVL